jgi:Flp pilus assembly protein TadD
MPSLTSVSYRGRLLAGAVLVPAALLLGGCAQSTATDPTMTASIAKPITQEDFAAAAQYWGQRYQANAKDRDAALNYAAALQRTGATQQAVAVLSKAAIDFRNDRIVLAALGKAQAANGDLAMALTTIQNADDPAKPDWKLLSAEGAILDQMNRTDEARALYAKALQLQPGDPSVLSNFGMSYVITGDLKQAEKLLRQAIASPNADSRVRQNLALVVGLQGRFAEAQKIASAEISPEQAAANVAYLKQMLAQQNNWQALKGSSAPAT